MDRNKKKQDAFEIFEDIFAEEEQSARSQKRTERFSVPSGEDPFYEIEYDSSPFPGVGKFVLRSDKIEAPARDETREKFDRMRDIARESRAFYFNSSKFYDRRVQQENSRIFFKQGMFMEDFEDDYEKSVSYSAYFPSYQTMGYDQLRTYFTWRTGVRQGNIEGTSLSYGFLYIYELLNLIGVTDVGEGRDRLFLFWDAFRVYDRTLDKYVPGWLKDYHIYYGLERSFRDFVRQNGLCEYFPEMSDPEDKFSLFCSVSKYDIRKSAFYLDGNGELLQNAFAYVIGVLDQAFAKRDMSFEEYVFQPVKNMPEWIPFKGALFYPHMAQDDRRVVLSEKEIYICSQDRWTFHSVLTTESGKKLVGYIMKQMESVLRKAARYKHKLTANSSMLSPGMAEELDGAGIDLEKLVTQASLEYYREATKTVVKIDPGSLDKIRQEALMTQEKLIVPEEEGVKVLEKEAPERFSEPLESAQEETASFPGTAQGELPEEEGNGEFTVWDAFGNALEETELEAVAFILFRQTEEFVLPGQEEKNIFPWNNIRQFADAHGVMLEVLADGINEKAMDQTGDNLLDDEFMIYEDYIDQAKEMVRRVWRHRYLQE